jgi:hypothetical protein
MPFDLIQFRDKPVYLGRWVLGEPVGANGFEKLPRVPSAGDAATPREKLDIRTASASLAMKPRFLWDALLEVRGALLEFAAADERLRQGGFGQQALRDALWRESGEETLTTLREAAGKTFDAADHIAKNRARLAAEYFEPEATETERAAFDLAIAQKFAAAETAERLRMRLTRDPRLLAALSRVPHILSEVTDADLEEMRADHVKANFPNSDAAFDALRTAIDALHTAIVAGLGMIEGGTGRPRGDLVAGWGPAGRWILDGDGSNA